jgi:hypothetical protein
MRRLALAVLLLGALNAGAQAPERHGASDAFAGDGVSIAWAVMRGKDEERTQVRLRVLADPKRYARFTVFGVDPFSKDQAQLVAPRAAPASVAIPRARFALLPRTEVRFLGADGRPALVVYYLSVPDTTPEFDSEAKLERYLESRGAGF